MCNIPADKLPYHLFGWCLQQPMGLILNWAIAGVCLVMFAKIGCTKNKFSYYWKLFLLFLGLSTIMGGLGHTFYAYFGTYGKMPAFCLSIIASFFVSMAMVNSGKMKEKTRLLWSLLIIIESVLSIVLTFTSQTFTFVLINTIITYIVFCLGFSIYFWKTNTKSFKYVLLGVGTLIPSAFVFILNFSPYLWLKKDDISHLIIIVALFLFFQGIRNYTSDDSVLIESKVINGGK